MASLFSRLNPVPAFPDLTGPHKVGTVDIELPVSALPTASSAVPDGAADIHTVLFRVFYPTTPEPTGKLITWLPAPQRLNVSAYAEFLGAGPRLAYFLSYLPRYLHFVTIPAYRNSPLLPSQSRWPVAVFSHGLGGNRNTYSHLAVSLASYGVVVVCPEHRDGSATVSVVRDPKNQDSSNYSFLKGNTMNNIVSYIRVPHAHEPDIWKLRNKQLRIRLWELGLVFEALVGLDKGQPNVVKLNLNSSTTEAALSQFTDRLDVQEPGKVIFGGHSFGAATIVQFLKSTFYADRPELKEMTEPLFVPKPDSAIRKQVTARNPIYLLDMWCFPLVSADAAPLRRLPLPAYSPGGPGGDAILAIESMHFYKWTEHTHTKARILSPNPSEKVVSKESFTVGSDKFNEPHFFYVQNSVHLNQSDFGILFPWLTKKAFGADQPERILRLNLRAQLQFLRANGVPVAATSAADLEIAQQKQKESGSATTATSSKKEKTEKPGTSDGKEKEDGDVPTAIKQNPDDTAPLPNGEDDKAILDRTTNADGKGPVEAWTFVSLTGLGERAGPTEHEIMSGKADKAKAEQADRDEKEMEGEMEPSLANNANRVSSDSTSTPRPPPSEAVPRAKKTDVSVGDK